MPSYTDNNVMNPMGKVLCGMCGGQSAPHPVHHTCEHCHGTGTVDAADTPRDQGYADGGAHTAQWVGGAVPSARPANSGGNMVLGLLFWAGLLWVAWQFWHSTTGGGSPQSFTDGPAAPYKIGAAAWLLLAGTHFVVFRPGIHSLGGAFSGGAIIRRSLWSIAFAGLAALSVLWLELGLVGEVAAVVFAVAALVAAISTARPGFAAWAVPAGLLLVAGLFVVYVLAPQAAVAGRCPGTAEARARAVLAPIAWDLRLAEGKRASAVGDAACGVNWEGALATAPISRLRADAASVALAAAVLALSGALIGLAAVGIGAAWRWLRKRPTPWWETQHDRRMAWLAPAALVASLASITSSAWWSGDRSTPPIPLSTTSVRFLALRATLDGVAALMPALPQHKIDPRAGASRPAKDRGPGQSGRGERPGKSGSRASQ